MWIRFIMLIWFFCCTVGFVASSDVEFLSWKSTIEEKLVRLEQKVTVLERERNVARRENARLVLSNGILISKMKHLESEMKHLKNRIDVRKTDTKEGEDLIKKEMSGKWWNYINEADDRLYEPINSMVEEKGDYDHEMLDREHEDDKMDYNNKIQDIKHEALNSVSEEKEDYGHEILNRKHEQMIQYKENNAKYRRIVPPTSSPQLDLVAFYCYLSKNTDSALSTHHILKYDIVPINKGNGYNKDDGIFTVPRTGVYIFTWTTVVGYRSFARTEIMVNGQSLGKSLPDSVSVSAYSTASEMIIVEANAGEHVYVRILLAGVGSITSNHETTTSFAGWSLN